MDTEHLLFVEKYGVEIEAPPVLGKESADVFLIRQGFTLFNYRQVKLKKESTNYAEQFKVLQANPELYDASLN